MKIFSVRFPEDAETLRDLFRRYENFLGISLCVQNFEEELASLPGKYAPPQGGCWIAWQNEKAVGCVALRPLDEATAELKRLFVLPEYAGQGIGRKLTQHAIHEARLRKYHTLYLDTLARLEPAIRLYKTLGFREVPPYHAAAVEGIRYFGLELSL